MIVSNALYALSYLVLEEEYQFKENSIYARDLFPDLQSNFLLFSIPKNSNSYQIKSSQMTEKFANEGISVGAKSPIITFKRAIRGEIEGIRKYILAEFLREYQPYKIQVNAVHLEQITPVDFKEDAILSIDFHSKLLKKREGSFDVVVQEKNGEQLRVRTHGNFSHFIFFHQYATYTFKRNPNKACVIVANTLTTADSFTRLHDLQSCVNSILKINLTIP